MGFFFVLTDRQIPVWCDRKK